MRNARPRRLGDGVIDGLASDQLRERRSLTEASNMAAVAERGTGDGVSLAEEENNGERGRRSPACMRLTSTIEMVLEAGSSKIEIIVESS